MTVTVGDISMMSTSVCVPIKDSVSPKVLKRKYLLKVVVPALATRVFSPRPASASLSVPVKKMKANNSEITSWKCQHEMTLPILTVNGEVVNLDNEDEPPSPSGLGLVGQASSHLLAPQQFTPVSETETLPLPVSPSMTHKKKVSSPRFFRKKSAKPLDAPSVPLLTQGGTHTGPEDSSGCSYYQDWSQEARPSDPPSQLAMAGHDHQAPAPQSSEEDSARPEGLKKKKKSFRNIFPLIAHKSGNDKYPEPEPTDQSPSAFEQELADQENQSPNDPEFVRRASQRWQRKTGAVNCQYLQMFSPFGCRDHVLPVQYTKFQWPTSPSQQSAFQRRVSPVHYVESLFPASPTLPVQGTSPASSPFSRSSRLYSSMIERSAELQESPFQRSSHSYSSVMMPSKCQRKTSCPEPSKTEHSSDKTSVKTKKPSIHMPFVRRSLTHVRKLSKTRQLKVPPKLSLDDSVAAEVRRVAMREELQVARQALLNRLSVRIRGTLQVPQRKTSQSSLTVTPTVTSSASYQSYLCSLSGLSRDSSFSSFSSMSPSASPSHSSTSLSSPQSSTSLSSPQSSTSLSSPSSSSLSSPQSSTSLSSSASHGHLTLQDIFIAEPKIAEKYAIMFPTEPRPEWHRHLRHVIHKAGQKIFKKPEQHDTTIPDNLRYQLKYIYVY
ncbi:uncharacterized protein [Procambarus clarkii]|uniref:uncharacterized protein n=1 Tax=Procambarus clarkii TaxID=6728 RepID=UPI0037438A74